MPCFLLHIPTFPFLCPPAQFVSSWRRVKSCQDTVRARLAVSSTEEPIYWFLFLFQTILLPASGGGNTVHSTWGNFFADFKNERLSKSGLRSGDQLPVCHLPLRTCMPGRKLDRDCFGVSLSFIPWIHYFHILPQAVACLKGPCHDHHLLWRALGQYVWLP